jgi:hypothetical protein
MMDADAAATAAQDALRSLHGPSHRALFQATASALPQVPIFVRRLDRPEQSSYLVPWRDARGIAAVIQIDAATGAMQSVAVFAAPLMELVLPEERARALATATFGPIIGDAELVWRPCRESTSALQPLYRFETGQGEIYVTANGVASDHLTPLGNGG